jgi:hypothetical protein
MRDQNRESRKQLYFERLRDMKVERGCAKCGERDPAVLDFHHRDGTGKEAKAGRLVHDDYGWERILHEVEKCDVLCANDHRRVHLALQETPLATPL